MSKKVTTTDQSTNTDRLSANNNISSIIDSLNTLDISDAERVSIICGVESCVSVLRTVIARAAKAEASLRTSIDTLVADNNRLQEELVILTERDCAANLLIQQQRVEKERLESQVSVLEQDRAILNAQLAEYRETLQELAGYQFLGIRFD